MGTFLKVILKITLTCIYIIIMMPSSAILLKFLNLTGLSLNMNLTPILLLKIVFFLLSIWVIGAILFLVLFFVGLIADFQIDELIDAYKKKKL